MESRFNDILIKLRRKAYAINERRGVEDAIEEILKDFGVKDINDCPDDQVDRLYGKFDELYKSLGV